MRDPMSLYPVDNPYPQARGMMGQAASSYGAMGQNRNTTTEGPGKTAGGAIMAGIGGAAAGMAMAGTAATSTAAATGLAALGMTGPGAPLAIAGLALGAYFLS